ncbi:kinase-like domain-containing protein [Suillus ampliporus]|nr:kinase-like domain-containing protein [Suillus ampliporus]
MLRYLIRLRRRLFATTAVVQPNSSIPSDSIGIIASAPLPFIIPESISAQEERPSTPPPVITSTHKVQPVAFDVDPFAIQITSIKKQSDYPTSCGGLGDIWKCLLTIDPATSIQVAVKVIRIVDIRNEKAIQLATKRLRREVAVWIKLRHPHLLTLHGTVSGFGLLPALVYTWMDNGALHGYLQRTTLTMEQKLQLLKQVVDGLGYLHSNGIIHGELTSTNVMIGRDGNACLADFGLSVALVEADRSYYDSYSSGTIRWLAPELMGFPEPASIKDGDGTICDDDFPKPNSQSDIFSLGCVFSGRLPFWWLGKVQHVFSAQLRHIEPYRDDSSVFVDPQHLEFMRKCWSVKPEGRPSIEDATCFVEDELGKFLLASLWKSIRTARNNDTNPASPPSPHSAPIQGDGDRGNDTHPTPPPAHSAPIQGDGDRGNDTNPTSPPSAQSALIQGDDDRGNDTSLSASPSAPFTNPIQNDDDLGNDTNPTSPPSVQSALIQDNGDRGNDANPSPLARLAGSSSPLRLRHLLGFLRFSTRPATAPQPIPMQPLRLRISRHSDRVATLPRSQPDNDVSPHISPRPWLGFFSRLAPSPRAAADSTELSVTVLPPKTTATQPVQPRQGPNQGEAPSSPPQALTAKYSPSPSPPPSHPLSNSTLAATKGKQRTRCWTRFWHCIRHCSCVKSNED